MVSSCNQIKRDSWSMNLCVETAPNVPTTLWEGGATRRGVWAWAPVPARVPRKAGSAASAAWLHRRAPKGFAAEGPGNKGAISLLTSFPTLPFPGGPISTFTVPAAHWPFLHGCFRSGGFQLEPASESPGKPVKTQIPGHPPLQHF